MGVEDAEEEGRCCCLGGLVSLVIGMIGLGGNGLGNEARGCLRQRIRKVANVERPVEWRRGGFRKVWPLMSAPNAFLVPAGATRVSIVDEGWWWWWWWWCWCLV